MIFLDTSGLVALFDARDSNHAAALKAWAVLHASAAPLVMTELIVVETVTLLRRRAPLDVVQRVGDRLLSGAVAEVVFTDAGLLERAWDVFGKYRDQWLSLTDCVSFALMKERRVGRAFTFDSDFTAVGFEAV